MFVIIFTFVLSTLIQMGSFQGCKLINPENNLLSIAVGETFRLPLTKYFTGQGITYELSENSGFEISNNKLGYGIAYGIVRSITSLSFNSNPYIQSFQYFALSQIENTNQSQIYASEISNESPYNISFTNSLATIDTGVCESINTIQEFIVVTCLTLNNELAYIVYNTLGDLLNTFTTEITFTQNPEYQEIGFFTVTSDKYIATQIYYNQWNAVPYVFSFDGINQPILIPLQIGQNQIVDLSLSQNILFALTDSSIYIYNLSSNQNEAINNISVSFYPTKIITYNIDYPSSYYLISLSQELGITQFIYDLLSNEISQTQQTTLGYHLRSSFINSRYLISIGVSFISVYPSLLNYINEGQLLYIYETDQSYMVGTFDYYNNILIVVSESGIVYTYQLNDPIITTVQQTLTQLPLENNAVAFTITATAYLLVEDRFSTCAVLTLFYQVVPQPSGNNTQIYQTYFSVEQKQYNQLGQQINMTFGSSQVININNILIGSALFISLPIVQPAISNSLIQNQYITILNVPQIKSQYKVNSNLFDGQKALFSQLFYDPTTLTVTNANYQFSDSYYQLIQYDKEIVLLQCQGIKDTPCQVIIEIPEKDILVCNFALNVNNGQINLAYYYNEINIKQNSIGKMSVFNLFLDHNSQTGYSYNSKIFEFTNNENLQDLQVNQIALIGADLYILYSATQTGNKQTYIQIANATQLVQGFLTLEDTYQFQLTDGLYIYKMYYDVISYGKLIFLQTSNTQIVLLHQILLPLTGCNSSSNQNIYYGLSMDGIYALNSNVQPSEFYLYLRVDLLPIVYQSQQQNISLHSIIKPISLPLFNVSSIIRAYGSARFFYVMVQQMNQYGTSIYVYRNTGTILNCLYYIIRAEENSIMYKETFSVISALQYDAIIFRSQGGNYNFYTSGYLLPELEIQINCNLNSNSQYQVSYNYLNFKTSSLLLGTTLPQTAQQIYLSFQITNLISFVSEKSIISNTSFIGTNLTLNSNGQIYIDPRTFFTGNIQTFTLNNVTDSSGYYFNMISTVVSQPQTFNIKNPITAVSSMMTFNHSNLNQQNQYWCTFVQTNHIVYITPYIYYNPQNQAFVQNTTVKIDYPLSYKLPILDPSPNSQQCPLIFVDQLSQGVVSVCGTKNGTKPLVSFTLYNTNLSKIQETQIINVNDVFNLTFNDPNVIYNLLSATYLTAGAVILQLRVIENLNMTDFILPFIYAARLDKPQVFNQNGELIYQYIQPMSAVFYVFNQTIEKQSTITPFSISTFYTCFNENFSSIIYGLLCVSKFDEECLYQSINAIPSGGVTVSIYINQNFQAFLNGSNTIDIEPCVLGNISINHFSISLFAELADYNIRQIDQIVQIGTFLQPYYQMIQVVPFVLVSKGSGYVIRLSFSLKTGLYITTQYSCKLAGLTAQNNILSVSASGYAQCQDISSTYKFQIVMVVSNPTQNNPNQVTLLNFGFINQQNKFNFRWCKGFPFQLQQFMVTEADIIVTAIGSYTYTSIETPPILSLMLPPLLTYSIYQQYPIQLSNIPRTLISNNSYIQLLDTSPTLILTAYPDYNIYQGVTLGNSTETISSGGIQAQVTAQPIQIYINNILLNGNTGSTKFTFQSLETPQFYSNKWFHQIWEQFIWGFIMFGIIVGVISYLFCKSQ